MQWWGSLTQQFQNIAAAAVKDVAAQAMKDKPRAARKTKSTPSKSRPSRAKKTAKPAPTLAEVRSAGLLPGWDETAAFRAEQNRRSAR
jgi:hypothetical protein